MPVFRLKLQYGFSSVASIVSCFVFVCATSGLLVSLPVDAANASLSLSVDTDFDWHEFFDPAWHQNLTVQQKIEKLQARLKQLPEAEKPLLWLSLVVFNPDEITCDTIRPLYALFSQCGELPNMPEVVAEKQWQKLLYLTVENPGDVLQPEERRAFVRKLLPVPSKAPMFSADAVDALVTLYHVQKNQGKLDSDEAILIIETLVRCSVWSNFPSYQKAEAEIQEDLYDHLTEMQASLLQLTPDLNEQIDDELPAPTVIRRLEKKLNLLEKYKVYAAHTKMSIAAEYFRDGQFAKAASIMQATLDAGRESLKGLPVSDQNARSDVAVTALCLAKTLVMQGDAQSASKTLDIAKQILPEFSEDWQCRWSPGIPAIEAEIASTSGNKSLAQTLYAAADAQFDVQRVCRNYALFLKSAPYAKLILPNEQTVLQDLITLLRSDGKLELARQKEKILKNIRIEAEKKRAEDRLSSMFDQWQRRLSAFYSPQDTSEMVSQAMQAVKSDTTSSATYKLDLIEHLAKHLIESSRFAASIDLINLALEEPLLAGCPDFQLHAAYLQQLKIRAEVTSGQFRSAQADCAEFLEKPTDKNPKLRNQQLDVRGWQARIKLLSGRPGEARKELEQLCSEWSKEGTNDFISDFREHVRDLATAYYDLHDYQEAARALRYYLAKLSYNNGSESYEAKSLLGLTYEQLGNIGLGEPLIDEVVSSLKERADDAERIYAITHIADFYLTAKDVPTALRYYRRANTALQQLNLERLPVAAYVQGKLHNTKAPTKIGKVEHDVCVAQARTPAY